MFSRFFRKKTLEPQLIVDIGSASAAVAVAVRNKDKVLVTHAERKTLAYESRSREQTISAITLALTEILSKILSVYARSKQAEDFGPITGSAITIHAPWTNSVTTRAEKHFEREVPIQARYIQELAREAIRNEATLDKAKILEAGLVRAELNGYPVTKAPKGLVARSIAVTSFETECEPELQRAVMNVVATQLPGRRSMFRSGTRLLTSVLRARAEAKRSYLLIDITSEASTFAVIRKEDLVAHTILPSGLRAILTKLNQNAMPEETLSLIRMIATDACASETCTQLASSITAIEPDLVKFFGDSLTSLGATGRLPNTLVLSVHPDAAVWLSHFFQRLDFAQFTITTKPFSVVLLTPEHVADAVQFLPGIPQDTALSMNAALFNTTQ